MSEINLLPTKDDSRIAQTRAAGVFRTISIVCLGMTAFLSVSLFILIIQSPLSQIEQEEQSLIANLRKYDTRISRNVIMQERIISIQKILKDRNTYDKSINTVISQMPSGIRVSSLELVKGTIQISGSSSFSDQINTFLNGLVALQKDKNTIRSILLNSFTLQGETGRYFFTLNISLL